MCKGGGRFADSISFYLIYPMEMKEFGLNESEPDEPSLDPPIVYVCVICILCPWTITITCFCSQKKKTMSSLQNGRPLWSAQISHLATDTDWKLHKQNSRFCMYGG